MAKTQVQETKITRLKFETFIRMSKADLCILSGVLTEEIRKGNEICGGMSQPPKHLTELKAKIDRVEKTLSYK